MARLTLDSISARTLPALDRLVASDDYAKLNEVMAKTPREALLRLALAALSRHSVPGGHLPPTAPEAIRVLEELVTFNLRGKGEAVKEFLDSLEDASIAVILKHSLLRFKMMEQGK